jgi:hypothetical protein
MNAEKKPRKPLSGIVSAIRDNRTLAPDTIPRWVRLSIQAAVYLLLVSFVLAVFVRESGVNRNPHAKLSDMVYGSAHRPYVYRVLLPSITRAGAAITPDAVERGYEKILRSSRLGAGFCDHFLVEPGFGYEATLMFLLMSLCLAGYSVFIYRLYRDAGGRGNGLSHIAPVLGLLALPPFFTFGYIYDFAVLLFTVFCLYMLWKRKLNVYLAAFALACLNKETAVVLAVAYCALLYDQLPARKFLGYGLAQLLVFGVIKTGIGWIFRDNPGELVIYTGEAQFAELLAGYGYGQFLLGLVLFVFIAYGWSGKASFFKRSLWMFPPLLVLFMVGGCPDEYRVFYEVLPVAVLLSADTLARAAGAGGKA